MKSHDFISVTHKIRLRMNEPVGVGPGHSSEEAHYAVSYPISMVDGVAKGRQWAGPR